MRLFILFALFTFAFGATNKRTKQTAKSAYELDNPYQSEEPLDEITRKAAEWWDTAVQGLQKVVKLQKNADEGLKLLRAIYQRSEDSVVPEGYLKVCQSSTSKVVATQVKETLRKTRIAFHHLIEAIQNNQKEQLVNGIRKAQSFMPVKVAAFYAGIKALKSLEQSQRSASSEESCMRSIRSEFEKMHHELHKLMPALKESIDEIRQTPGGQDFINIFQNLMQVRVHFDKYLETSTKGQRENFVQVCHSQQIRQQTKQIQQALKNFKEQIEKANVQEKDLVNIAEVSTGLFAQSVALKASCNEAELVDRSLGQQTQQLKADINENQSLLKDFLKNVEEILGSNQEMFERKFGPK